MEEFVTSPFAQTVLVTIFRFLHIITGIIWVGFGTLIAWLMIPTAQRMGERGATMLRTFVGYTPVGTILGISALVTTIAGLLLWPFRVQGAIDFRAFTDTGDIVMAIGAVFGLLAFGHGATATGRYTGVYAAAAKAYDENPSDANSKALEDAQKKMTLHANVSAWLTVIAVVGMAGARYL